MKVELEQHTWSGHHNYALGPKPVPVKRSLPYMRSKVGTKRLVHRVRSGMLFYRWPEHRLLTTHISMRLWCGNSLTRGELLAEMPPDAERCHRCFPPMG